MLRKHKRKNTKEGEAGFTMVELIIVIVLTSILGTFVFNILGQCLSAQNELQVRRAHSDDAVLALHKMSKDIMESTSVIKGSATTAGSDKLTLNVDSVNVVYDLVNEQLLRDANVIAREVVSLTATVVASSVKVALVFNGENGSRELEVMRRN